MLRSLFGGGNSGKVATKPPPWAGEQKTALETLFADAFGAEDGTARLDMACLSAADRAAAPADLPACASSRALAAWNVASGAVLVPVFILIAVAAYYRGEKRKRKEYTQKKVREAIIALRSIDHPYTFIPANEFLKLGKLRPHEELRDERKLLYFDSVKGLDEQKKIVFFSHQWTAWAEPDPDVLQYPVMVAALRHVVRHSGWKLDDVVVWVDLFSIPQANRKLQILHDSNLKTWNGQNQKPLQKGSPCYTMLIAMMTICNELQLRFLR